MNTVQRTLLAAALAAAAGGAAAQSYTLEGAVIDSRSAQSLGVVSERGEINALFRAQKAMTFGILRAAGISLDQLPPEVRARIERFQTTNLEAFRAFSQGLDLKDLGRFAEAKEQFRRAAELDPNFALAAEQQRAMPDVNLGSGAQARAVVVAAAGAAVDRGKASFAVDTSRALAALAAGATVVTVPLAGGSSTPEITPYTANEAGSASNLAPNIVAGYAYTLRIDAGTTLGIADAAEWRGDRYLVVNNALESLGTKGDFVLAREQATQGPVGSRTLADGSSAYWGSWLSTDSASASLTVGSNPAVRSPVLGQRVDYLQGEATRLMPATGTGAYDAPATLAGTLAGTTGSILVDFTARRVTLQDLAFSAGGFAFTGLAGAASYDNSSGNGPASGTFRGNYSAGACALCPAFSPTASSFNGSFLGRNADGLAFSTILVTGSGGTVSGLQLFTKRP